MKLGFCLLDGSKQGDLSGVVAVDAHAQIDLARTGVCREGLVQSEDRVAGGHWKRSKR